MKASQVWILLLAGVAVWLIGTVYFALRGPSILETTALRYGAVFMVTPLCSVLLCVGIMCRMGIPPEMWPQAMLLIALPGMVGEAAVLSRLSAWMPRCNPLQAGAMGPSCLRPMRRR